MPSVLLHCLLGVGKSIRSVKMTVEDGVRVVICLERDTDCLLIPLHPRSGYMGELTGFENPAM